MRKVHLMMSLVMFFILPATPALSQFNYLAFNNESTPELIIKQVDQYDFSTVIHFTYNTISSLRFNGSEDIKLTQAGEAKGMINSYNLPLDEKVHMFNETGEYLNFSLEFEKIDISKPFEISSVNSRYFDFEKVSIDTAQKGVFQNVDAFVSQTPSREYYVFYHEGFPVLKYAYKGIVLAVKLQYDQNYGSFFQPQIIVQNYNKKDVLVDPSKIFAQYGIKGKYFNALVIDYKKYLNNVKRVQSNERFYTGLVDGIAAISAGYSYISANSNTYVTANGRTLNYGFFGNNLYANAGYSSGSAYTSTNVSGRSFDGGKVFIAAQVAKQNMDNLKVQQVQKLNTLQSGYVKLNTIFTNSDYEGYINIPYAKNADKFLMKIEINNNEFFFEWDDKELKNLIM
ncbi:MULTISPECIES: hypothetical protein [Sphingobacterium]|uniref:hypothetical protein n=2 Tax=Sphingobacteriaceae TaxID=84566 RepID=UPI0013DBC37F|nr:MULTISPECIES: hypothetical protein [unclassified Sphingobacterium]